jgi:RNA polymerase sigma-70 factor (ECF subfamily)
VDGVVGIVVAPLGKLLLVINVKVAQGKIIEIEAIADPESLSQVHLAAFQD